MISANKNAFAAALGGIVLLAGALRLAGLGFGLPDLFHQDEPILINHAMAIGAGGWHPRFFILPPFCMYFLFLVYAAGFLFLKLAGAATDASSYALLFLKDPTPFYWTARFFLGAVFGTATVWLVGYRLSRSYSKSVALCAALFLALLPLHVRHSHYAYTDGTLTFAMTLLLFELLRVARREGGRMDYVRAGAALGWAVSIKYTAAYVAGAFLAAWWIREKAKPLSRESLTGLFLFGAVSLGVFAVIAPYTFLDWSSFFAQIRHQAGAESALPIFHHLTYSLIGGSGFPFILTSLIGLLALFKRGCISDGWVMAVFLVSFYMVNSLFGQPYARYVLPLFPLLCALAAIGWDTYLKPVKRLGGLTAVLLAAALGTNALYSDMLFLRSDTRTLCREWFEKNIQAGSRVLLSSRPYGPRLAQTEEQIRMKYAKLGQSSADSIRRKRLDLEMQLAGSKKTFAVFTLSEAPAANPFLADEPLIRPDPDVVRAARPQYWVINRAESRPEVERLLAVLAPRLEKVIHFSPYRDASRQTSLDAFASTAAPDMPREMYLRQRLGPYLEVYRFKEASEGS